VAADRRCAVLGQSVVPLRMVGEPIDFIEIVNQQTSRLRRWNADAIQIDLLIAIVGSQSDQVAFIGDHVVELVLVEEATQRRIGLTFLFARLDRDGKVLAVIEVPARDGMRDLGRSPIRQEQVHAVNAVEIVSPRLPSAGRSLTRIGT
jgi:hypothetical protein